MTDEYEISDFYDAIEDVGRPVLTADEVARALDCSHEDANRVLERLAEERDVARLDVENDPVVWFPTEWERLADRERIVVFPKRREIVADQPAQFTRAQLSQFAHLTDTTRAGSYSYRVREEDIWSAPYDSLETLMRTVRQVLPEPSPDLEGFIEAQWKRARQFRLYTHEDGYVVLEAASDDLMGNVARQKLSEDHLRAPIADDESWVAEDKVAEVKRILYEAGYPVQDERDLETGDDLDITCALDLRDYQREWVEEFVDLKSGVLVGPPGSGKTVAAMGVLEAVSGESLILVPGRELAGQWRDELLASTSLTPEQVGEYHGGEKNVRPVTIATYQTAGMDRHRQLFDQRRWGLIVYDECQHIPSRVFRRSADLQSKHRLGLSATPVREDDKEKDIFTLIGPPIGTDWDALFEAGFVAEPEVEIRYVGWDEETYHGEYANADGRGKRRIAATNPAKLDEIRFLLAEHPTSKALVFVEYLEQGDRIAEALDVPFLSGQMRHAERERHLQAFRDGREDTLVISRVGDEGIDLPDAEIAIVASGLGGSRRQGAQRAGRTMRPAGRARMYVLATRGTREEEFARQQLRHLASKGIRIQETVLDEREEDD
ncbi:DEAD/DEAH box helicase [Haladaptatus sp. T7]|uniref:DEAD/DEAH box helicase n=1 Tax=Haladaptatus sp. T7 TaxID=2029368 RepID=UPI0021A25383|nr:DEAD/DEAH box helicase [Haladaptatus sp. T7]GKZ15830.1 helicase [Haladaptatus sp. T7]